MLDCDRVQMEGNALVCTIALALERWKLFKNQGVGLLLLIALETLKEANDRSGQPTIKLRNSMGAEGLHRNFYLFLSLPEKGSLG